MSASRRRLLNVVASTKRRPTANATRGEPVPHLSSIRVASLMPNLEGTPGSRGGNPTMIEGWQTFTEATDILQGDTLVIGGVEYPVTSADLWPASSFDAPLMHLIVQDQRR